MVNRILQSILQVRERQSKLSPAQLEQYSKDCNMNMEEYSMLQNYKSLASTNGTLTLEEAQYVYGLMGETLETFNNQSFAEKYVLTKLLQELMAQQLKKRGML